MIIYRKASDLTIQNRTIYSPVAAGGEECVWEIINIELTDSNLVKITYRKVGEVQHRVMMLFPDDLLKVNAHFDFVGE